LLSYSIKWLFSGKPIFTEFLKNKLGIKVEEVMQGKHASLMGFSQPSDSEMERLNALVNAVYENFIEKVSQGRHLSKEKLAQYATGRVFVGSEAVKIGLVDEIGKFQFFPELISFIIYTISFRWISQGCRTRQTHG